MKTRLIDCATFASICALSIGLFISMNTRIITRECVSIEPLPGDSPSITRWRCVERTEVQP